MKHIKTTMLSLLILFFVASASWAASYAELYQIMSFQVEGSLDLRNKVCVAALVTADKIASGNDDGAPFDQVTLGAHDQRIKWAEMAYKGDISVCNQVFRAVIAANDGATQSAILGASDATIQSNVDAVVDALAANL